jgi:hypothetical protein
MYVLHVYPLHSTAAAYLFHLGRFFAGSILRPPTNNKIHILPLLHLLILSSTPAAACGSPSPLLELKKTDSFF